MYILRSKYLLINPDCTINNGAVLIGNDGKIMFAGPFHDLNNSEQYPVVDFENAVIVPGFVNTHTHLELTHLHRKINFNGFFTDWIRQLVNEKKNWADSDYRLSVREGIRLSLESGTTTVADITRNGLALGELLNSNIRKTLFYELIDFNPVSASHTIESFKELISGVKTGGLFSLGIFPHAPYTVSEPLYRGCRSVADQSGMMIATHISETTEEVEFLTKGTGHFVSLLNDFDMLGNWKPPELRPIHYLKNIGFLQNTCILIHCNYLTEEDANYIERSNSHVVFCPGSHRYFKHKAHPLPILINHDINIALGTDSLASNDSLSILDEMKFLYANYDNLNPRDIFYMGTIAGTIALRLQDRIGRLESGFDADIAVIGINGERVNNIFDSIFSHEAENVLTVVSGRICYDKSGITQNKITSEYAVHKSEN